MATAARQGRRHRGAVPAPTVDTQADLPSLGRAQRPTRRERTVAEIVAEHARRLDEQTATAPGQGGYLAASSRWMTRELAQRLAGQEDWVVRRRLADNPTCPPDVLARLSRDPMPAVSGQALSNPATPFGTVERYAGPIRVLTHPGCPADRLLVALDALDAPADRGLALLHGNLPLHTLEALVDTAGSDDITSMFGNPNLTHAQALRLISRPECPPNWEYHWAKHPNADVAWLAALAAKRLIVGREFPLTQVAGNPSTPPGTLAAIVHARPDVATRSVVLANPACPRAVLHESLEWISRASDAGGAALAALEALIAVNPAADHATLARIPRPSLGEATTSDPAYVHRFTLAHARTPEHAHAVLQLADGWVGSLAELLNTAETVIAS